MGTWFNADGLYIKYGTDEGVSSHKGGEYLTLNGAGEQVLEVTINLKNLTQTDTIINDVVAIPANALISWVEVQTVVAATSAGAAILDVGLISRDRSTAIDLDGLLAAAPLAQMNLVGETFRLYQTHTEPTSMVGTGALIGEAMTTAGGGLVTASIADTNTFTAGVIKVRIAYVPRGVLNP